VVAKSLPDNGRSPLRMAALALLALLGSVCFSGLSGLSTEASARTWPGYQQIAGTWVATWQNSRGASRKGLIVVEQQGADLTARIESHGNVTATGRITGSNFILRGARLGVPFTITGQVKRGKMTGTLSAILVERRFTATRRRSR
jgi:hypothetical protein